MNFKEHSDVIRQNLGFDPFKAIVSAEVFRWLDPLDNRFERVCEIVYRHSINGDSADIARIAQIVMIGFLLGKIGLGTSDDDVYDFVEGSIGK